MGHRLFDAAAIGADGVLQFYAPCPGDTVTRFILSVICFLVSWERGHLRRQPFVHMGYGRWDRGI